MVFLFAFLLVLFILILSKIRIEINNLQFNSKKIKCSHLNDDYKISIKLIILKVIPLIWVNIDKQKIEKIKQKQKINFKNLNKKISKEKVKKLIEQIQIKNFYLKLNFGTDFTLITSILIPVLSTIIATKLSKNSVNPEKQRFEIHPIYNFGNAVDLVLSTILEINVIDIIKIYTYTKKI